MNILTFIVIFIIFGLSGFSFLGSFADDGSLILAAVIGLVAVVIAGFSMVLNRIKEVNDKLDSLKDAEKHDNTDGENEN